MPLRREPQAGTHFLLLALEITGGDSNIRYLLPQLTRCKDLRFATASVEPYLDFRFYSRWQGKQQRNSPLQRVVLNSDHVIRMELFLLGCHCSSVSKRGPIFRIVKELTELRWLEYRTGNLAEP